MCRFVNEWKIRIDEIKALCNVPELNKDCISTKVYISIKLNHIHKTISA